MGDVRLYAEIVSEIDDGFLSLKCRHLDRLYKKYNSRADRQDQYFEAGSVF